MQISMVEPSYQGKLQSLFMETYPECLFIMNMLPSPHTSLFLHIWVADHIEHGHVLTTTCDFKRGGAKKQSSWNIDEKNRLDLFQVQKCHNVIMIIVFEICL